ncbi:MAG: hypothetical protein ACKVPX_15780 [Myxococcaceae bacterium]
MGLGTFLSAFVYLEVRDLVNYMRRLPPFDQKKTAGTDEPGWGEPPDAGEGGVAADSEVGTRLLLAGQVAPVDSSAEASAAVGPAPFEEDSFAARAEELRAQAPQRARVKRLMDDDF